MNNIKEFNFESKSHKTITEIKEILNVKTLELKRLDKDDGTKTKEYWHWEKQGHFAVQIGVSLVDEIKSNKDLPLFLFKSFGIGKKVGKYTRFEIYKQSDVRTKRENKTSLEIKERETYTTHRGSYAQEYLGYSDQLIDDVFDGDASNYWNID